jgi:hypothetical protein
VDRRCARPLCNQHAAVVLLFDYGARSVVLDWVPAERDPNLLEICVEHADRFTPPLGWTSADERLVVRPLPHRLVG